MVDIIKRWVTPMARDWQRHGSAHEVARLLTAPARQGLVRLDVRHATISVGTPIRVAETGFTRSTNRARREVTDQVMGEIRRLCRQEYVDEYAPLPSVTRVPTSSIDVA